MNRSTKLGVVFLCIFALPFALGGLAAIKQAIHMAQTGPANAPYWMVAFFGAVFTGVGFGLVFVAFYGAKRLLRQQQLEAEHPTEPWLWRPDWAKGRANSSTSSNTIAGWAFAIFWNAVSMPVGFLVLPAASKQKGLIAYIVLIFPVIGIFLLIRAIRQTIALFEFGHTYFEMSSVPGVVGRELKGQIQARFPHSPEHGIHLRLSCAHRVTTNSGNSTSTTEQILYRDEADLSSGQLCPGPTGTTIPVCFSIPLDAQPTQKRDARDEFVWLLEALADVPGVDYHDTFEVPVFRTQQTPTQAETERFAKPELAQVIARPAVATVRVSQQGEGTEFYFPAARNKSFATSATTFGLMFSAATFLMFHRAPFLFPLVFGLFSVLLVYISIRLWLATTRVVIGNGGLTLQSGLLGGGKIQRYPLSEISFFKDKITAQQGGATGVPYYDIEVTLRDGKRLRLGQSVSNKHEVEWLLSEMRRLAGVPPKSMTAGMGMA